LLGTYFARDASYAHEYTDVKLTENVSKGDGGTASGLSVPDAAAAADDDDCDDIDADCTEVRVAQVKSDNIMIEGLSSVLVDGSDVKMTDDAKVLPATKNNSSNNGNNSDSGDVGRQQSRVMVAARVFVGRYTTGHRTYRKPPPLDRTQPHSSVSFDSCVNYIDDPTLFVIFDSSQCYPEYFITYCCAPE